MIHELYGRLAEENALVVAALENEAANHRETVDILRQVVSGEIPAERVTVDGNDWRIAPALVDDELEELPTAEPDLDLTGEG